MEVRVEGERVEDVALLHQLEADRIDEGVLPLVVLAEPLVRGLLELTLDVDDAVALAAPQGIDEPDAAPWPNLRRAKVQHPPSTWLVVIGASEPRASLRAIAASWLRSRGLSAAIR